MPKINTESFILKAKSIHGNKYDYSLVEYKDYKTKVIIKCKKHGDFTIAPNNHVNHKQGCKLCGNNTPAKKEFIDKCNKIHNFKYNYEHIVYEKLKDIISIICPIHGEFKQNAFNHMNGKGCVICGNNLGSIKKKNHHKNDRKWNFTQPEDYKLIPLTKGKFAKVDNEDFERLKDINWCYTINDYAINDSLGLMHRYIMNTPDGMDTDHINHDKTDNRKSNLRICTRTYNNANRIIRSGYTSKYKGVSWSKTAKKWFSQIAYNNKLYSLGYYDDEIEAAKEYDKKAIELFGEFALTNFKDE